MNSNFVKSVIKDIAKEEGLSKEEIKAIVESPFIMTAQKMKQGDRPNGKFYNTWIMDFGKFVVNPERIKHIKQKELNKNNKNNNSNE